MKTYIAYYRVSTKKQGLGIEAQKEIVAKYINANGGIIVNEYSEKMSGKDNNRPGLNQALADCKKVGATLIVAKMDRLTRDFVYGGSLCKNYSIMFCDHPQLDDVTLPLFFGLAQQERNLISQRTKQALAVRKAQGKPLGTNNPKIPGFTMASNIASIEARRNKTLTNPNNVRAVKHIQALRKISANLPFKVLADSLNESDITTARGGNWQAVQVQRLCKAFGI